MAFRIETALSTRLPRDGDGRHPGFLPGADIDLSDPQVQREVCLRGFAGPEHDGCWTEQTSALLQFRMAAGADDLCAVWISAMPFVTPTHAQQFELSCDGEAIGSVRLGWEQGGRQVLKLIRPDAGIGNPWMRIGLTFRDPSSPAAQGESEDARPLGLKIARIAFTAPYAPAPPLFEGPVIVVSTAPTETPAPDPVARLEARARALDAKLDLVMDELRAVRGLADQARTSAARVAAALDRAFGSAPGNDAG